MRSTMDIKRVVAAGGGLVLDCSKYSAIDLKNIASVAKAPIILKNVNELSTMDMKGIAAAGNGNVIFDLC
ncbi:MAG: hypothetical protein K6E18_01935 [Lachnospiraceae bacterium]|nr:hypothetical protein [Lachnospiraceae bacterium]